MRQQTFPGDTVNQQHQAEHLEKSLMSYLIWGRGALLSGFYRTL
jgi:hypothetical protein